MLNAQWMSTNRGFLRCILDLRLIHSRQILCGIRTTYGFSAIGLYQSEHGLDRFKFLDNAGSNDA
jgi:hypothetical protein